MGPQPHTQPAQTQANESEQKFRNILLQSPNGFCILKGPDMVIDFVNQPLLTSWEKDWDILGKPLLDVFPELGAQPFPQLLQDVYTTGKPYYGYEEKVVLQKSGMPVENFYNYVYQPVINADGTISAITVMATDVTDQVMGRKKIQEEQLEAGRRKRLYETIMGNTPDLVYVFGLDYRFTYANEALLTMWGLDWEQAIGKGLRENGYEPWHAELHEREIDRIVATKKPVRGEVAFPHATLGRRVYDYILVPVLNEKGEVEAVAGTTRDISEIKSADLNIRESEERFRKLADDSPMFVFIIDADIEAPVSYWNKTWLQYTGQSMAEAIGRAWDGIIHPDDVPVVMEEYVPAFQNRQSYFIPSVRVKRHDGTYRWHAFKGNPRYLSDGEFNGYVGVGFDIHEQKLSEEMMKESEALLQIKVAERTDELQRTIEALQWSNNNLEEFAYAASHDLKEPIRKIHFFSDRLKSTLAERMSDEEKKSFERMETSAKRMSSLIDDLLSYSQVSLRPKSYERIDLNQLLELVLNDLDLEIEQKNASIRIDKLCLVQGHHRQLQQAFQNLISNSLKYSRPGTAPHVHISCKQLLGKDTGLHLLAEKMDMKFCVVGLADNGIGFEQKDAERIFNVFTRLHGNVEYKGTGVGLSIVRKVIENHHGYITANSRPGEGATFKIYLPAG